MEHEAAPRAPNRLARYGLDGLPSARLRGAVRPTDANESGNTLDRVLRRLGVHNYKCLDNGSPSLRFGHGTPPPTRRPLFLVQVAMLTHYIA